MPICLNCEKEFEAKRSDAQLCSAKCRQQFKRKGNKLRGTMESFKSIIPTIGKNMANGNPSSLNEPEMAVKCKFDGISRITKTPKEGMDKLVREGVERVRKAMQAAPLTLSFRDYMDLIKTGNYDRTTVTKQVNEDKNLNSNQKSMIYSKLK